mmetsp:Transcript_44/g.88  ORF Transcript_44/g.88 Transcript_44/m.88 type:complete len:198 (-) Transcript_44:124-717(-)
MCGRRAVAWLVLACLTARFQANGKRNMTAPYRKHRKKLKHKSKAERFREWYRDIDGGKGYLHPEEEEKLIEKKREKKRSRPGHYWKAFMYDLEHYWPNKTGLPGLKVFSRKVPKKIPRQLRMPNPLERRFRPQDIRSFDDAITYYAEQEWEESDSYPFPDHMKMTVPDDGDDDAENDTFLEIFEKTVLPEDDLSYNR